MKVSVDTSIGTRIMPQEAIVTAEAVLFFDLLFDAMNGVIHNDKPKASRCLMDDKSYHIEFLKDAKQKIRKMRFINSETFEPDNGSVPSLKSLYTNIDSFFILWKKLKKFGFENVNLRNLNQDPMENRFVVVRAYECRAVKPTCYQFSSHFRTLVINNFTSSHSIGANCAPDNSRFLVSWADYQEKVQHVEPNYYIPPGRFKTFFPNNTNNQCSLHIVLKEIAKFTKKYLISATIVHYSLHVIKNRRHPLCSSTMR